MKNALSAAGRTINRHRKAAVAAVLAVAVGVAIVTVNPWSISSYSLNSAGVWVQKAGALQVQRVDTSVHAWDASVAEPQGAIVIQDGQETVVADPTQLTPLNSATAVDGRATPLGAAYPNVQPGKGGVVLGGGVLAVRGADHGATEVWVGTFDGSTITLPPHPQITFAKTDQSTVQIDVGRDGTTVAYSDDAHVLERLVAGGTAPSSTTLQSGNFSAPQLSVAGGQGVVLFPDARTVDFGDGGSADISAVGRSPELQSWNGTGTSVGLASDQGLYWVTEGRGVEHLQSVTATKPVRPVVDARGCVYGAWGTGGGTQISRVCPSSGPSVVATRKIKQTASEASGFASTCEPSGLAFRGDALSPVLQSADGCAFVAVGAAFYAIPWADITSTSGSQTAQIKPRDPKATVTAITAPPVTLYARVGTEAYLPVLANDYDTAGDQLYVTGVSPAAGAAVPVPPACAPDGRTVTLDLQTALPALVNQRLTFTYTVANGRGLTATGAVTVNIIGLHQEAAAPVLLPGHDSPVLYVAKGSSGTYDVLKDWVSSDGMPLSVQDASVFGGSTVTWSSTGWITVNYSGTPNTVVTVTVQGYDGQKNAYVVAIKDVGPSTGCPDLVVVDDVAVGQVGQQIVVQPLKNDQDPSGSGLQLGAVRPLQGGPAPSSIGETVTFTPAAAAGSWSYTYEAKTGQCPAGAIGYIRIQADASTTPVATPFTVDVPSGGAATVDVLTHVTDPLGGVLALTDVTWTNVPGDAACSAQSPVCGGVTSLIDHTGRLRLVDSGGPPGPVGILSYSVSNTTGVSKAQVFIVRSVPAAGDPRLVCHVMNATVAPGGVVSVPVLQQAWSSYGRAITVSMNIPSYPPPSTAWTDGSSIRYFAPSNAPPSVLIPYEIATGDVTDGTQDCFVVVRVGTNSTAPLNPQNLDVSVVVNDSTTISVPLTTRYDGTPVDPNGSSVDLVGVSIPPRYGKVVLGTDGTSLTYTASGPPGPDTFTYQVKNQVGIVGTGTVNILLLPTSTSFAPPVAAPDAYRLLAGRTVNLPVLDNDADPQGRSLSVRAVPSAQSTALGASVTPDGHDLHVSVPSSCSTKDAAGNCQWVLQYEAVAGAEVSAPATVTIQSAPSAGLPPTAHDVFVAYPKSGTTATLSLASYVTNPGAGAVTFSLPFGPSTASVDPSGVFRVTLQQNSEAIVYTATDPGTNLKASGVIWVPGLVAQPPTHNQDQGPIKLNVRTGPDSVPVDLTQYLSVAQGATLHVQSCQTSDTALTSTSCSSLHATLTASNSIATGFYWLYVTAFASDANGRSNSLVIPIEVVVTGDTVISVLFATVSVTLTDTTTSSPIDLYQNVNCGGCQRTDLTFAPTQSVAPVTVQPSQGNSVVVLTANTGNNKLDNSTIPLQVQVCPPNNTSGCKQFSISVQLKPPTITVLTTQCVLTVAVNQSRTCDLTQYINASVSDGAIAPTLNVGNVTGQSPGWTTTVIGLSLSITPTTYSASPVTLTYSVSTYDRPVAKGVVVITTQAKPDAPGTPTLGPLLVQGGANKVLVTWTAPLSNGSPITSYTVTALNSSSAAVPPCKVATASCTLTLSPGSSYQFSVFATNSLGDGPASPVSDVIQTKNKPLPVIGLAVNPGDKQLTVTWNQPASDPLRPVESYQVTTDKGGSCTNPDPGSAAPTSICSGLTNGTQYTVQVLAVNAIGPSDQSTMDGVPFALAAAPTGLQSADESVVNDRGQFTLNWTAPGDTGGFTVTNYVITASPGDATCTYTPNSSPPSASCTNLELNQSYTFNVGAQTTPTGPGLTGQPLTGAIATSNPETVFGVPSTTQLDAPTWAQGAKDTSPTVSWTVPGVIMTAKATVTKSCVALTNTDPLGSSPQPMCTTDSSVTSLQPTVTAGQTYTAVVTLTYSVSNGQGNGNGDTKDLLSGASAPFWAPVKPGAPTAVSSNTNTVQWGPSSSSAGMSGFSVTATGADGSGSFTCTANGATSNSCILTSSDSTAKLTVGTKYSVSVVATPPVTEPTGVSPDLYMKTVSVVATV